MNGSALVFVVLAAGWAVACGSDPAQPPTSPTSTSTSATPIATTQPAPTGTTFSNADVMACLGNADPTATDACKSCLATSCPVQLQAVGSACPAFTTCVCNGGNMAKCASNLGAPGCGQAGMAVGACRMQSCATQCPSPLATPMPTATTPTPGATPGTTGGDPCAMLAACCAKMAAGPQQTSCTSVVTTKSAMACSTVATQFQGAGLCH